MFFFRPVLELTVLLPGMLLAYLPVKTYLKQTPLKLTCWMLPLLTGICISGGLLCYFLQISFCHLCFLWHCFFTTILCAFPYGNPEVFFLQSALFLHVSTVFPGQLMPLLPQIRSYPVKLCGFIPKPAFYTI